MVDFPVVFFFLAFFVLLQSNKLYSVAVNSQICVYILFL